MSPSQSNQLLDQLLRGDRFNPLTSYERGAFSNKEIKA